MNNTATICLLHLKDLGPLYLIFFIRNPFVHESATNIGSFFFETYLAFLLGSTMPIDHSRSTRGTFYGGTFEKCPLGA